MYLYCSSTLAQLVSRPLRGTISNAVQVHDSAWPATPAVVNLNTLITFQPIIGNDSPAYQANNYGYAGPMLARALPGTSQY
jgi:hypothetical protein